MKKGAAVLLLVVSVLLAGCAQQPEKPKVIEDIYSTLVRIKEVRRTIIVAEQGISAVMAFREYVDEVYFMSDHRITFRGSVDELENVEEIRRVYFGI